MSPIPVSLRQQIRAMYRNRCAYCQSPEALMGVTFEVDHIVPEAAGGATVLDNLCLSCPMCNRHKGARTSAVDPQTSDVVALFHPVQQLWKDHFAWAEKSTRVVGETSTGRATAEALRLNRPLMVELRRYWVETHRHPPK